MRALFVSYFYTKASTFAFADCVVEISGTLSSFSDLEVVRKRIREDSGCPNPTIISFQFLEPTE
jgi:hypothetical protein